MLLDYLPEVLLLNILLKLSVLSLVRLRCVCKHLNDIISSHDFRELYNQRDMGCSSSYEDGQLLVWCSSLRYTSEKKEPVRTSLVLLDHAYHVERILDFPFPGHASIHGICNGIISVYLIDTRKIILWNPALREIRVLPDPPFEMTGGNMYRGFGFDAVTNDYKVVRIIPRYRYCPKGQSFFSEEIEVYSLTTGVWRKIVLSQPFSCNSFIGGTYACGAYHWISYLGQEEKMYVVSFDMNDEKFYWMYLPDYPKNAFCKLRTFGGSLALIFHPIHQGDEEVHPVWVRDGDHIAGSWTKQYVKAYEEWSMPKLFCKDGIYHLTYPVTDSEQGRLIFYESSSGEFKGLDFGEPLPVMNAYLYKESLVSVKP